MRHGRSGIASGRVPRETGSCPRTRRDVLKCAVALGVGATLSPSFALAQDPKSSQRPQAGDRLVRVDDESRRPMSVGEVPVDAMQTFAWALDPADGTVRDGSRLNRVLLVRLD